MCQAPVMDGRTTYLASQNFRTTGLSWESFPLNSNANCRAFHYAYPSFHIWEFRCIELGEDAFSWKYLAETSHIKIILCSIKYFKGKLTSNIFPYQDTTQPIAHD